MSGTRVRAGLSTITANMGNNNYLPPQGYKVGKVYTVILNDKSGSGFNSIKNNITSLSSALDGIDTKVRFTYTLNVERPCT